ncbi:class I SAM-dependent methyltransferase [Ktedonosporobacter rubrisoli]|uniref:Class I SAM-dependent methyltransferase n=1 Tax=Ktedonosporobacter rubrisoli TaxID=2509675 RepID=A0A4P6K2T3_KTERU|nr:class I SAM-dependent methyltransferase [Ktedonosporobacter rubrisoli]QBD82183.1 class I SAM-dependent methyltransferase [Ktedonosporobacter rubrisoli]
MPENRTDLRTTFDYDALLYDEARPGYPEELFEDILTFTELAPSGYILEIGCGTGKATLPLARRGYPMLCVELGANLAAVAQRKLLAYPQVKFSIGPFEEWPVEKQTFDLVISATAFHWLDPTIAYQKVATALKPSGAIALFWHKHVQSQRSQGFFEAVQKIYRQEVPGRTKDNIPLLWAEEIDEPHRAEIEQSGLFGEITARRYRMDITYDAASYIRLLSTYSGHIAMSAQARQRLFQGITELINNSFHGHINKTYLILLYLAKRK